MKTPQAQGVHPKQQVVEQGGLVHEQPPHPSQKKDGGHSQSHQGAGGVLKSHGGRQPQNQVPDHPAAHGGDQPQNTHPKQVHPLFQAREGPRGGKGHGPDEIDNPNKRFDGRHLQTMRLP